MTPLFQLAASLVAEVRSLIDDISRGLVLSGLTGAIIVVLDRGRRSPEKLAFALGIWTLVCVVGFLAFVWIFD